MSQRRYELKRTARERMVTAEPRPLLVGLVFFLIAWFINFLNGRIMGQAVSIDYGALMDSSLEATAQAVTYHPENMGVLGQLLCLALEIVSLILSFGFILYAMRVNRRESASVGTLFDAFGYSLRIIGLNLFKGLFVALWSLLLFFPGFIAAYSYRMADYLLLDHPDWGIFRCLKESRKLMRGHKWELFVLDLSFLGWHILCLCPPVTIFVNPYIQLTLAGFYDRLVGIPAAQPQDAYRDGEKPPWEY